MNKYNGPKLSGHSDMITTTVNGIHVWTHKLIAQKISKLSQRHAAMIHTAGSFCVRKKRGSDEWSVHSWGAAIDINEADNSMGVPKKILAARKYFLPDSFIDEMVSLGFVVLLNSKGENYDRMHFQLKESDIK